MSEGRVGYEADAELAEQRENLGLDVAGPQGVFGLQGCYRVYGVGTADGGGPGLGQSDVADLALDDEVGQRADGLLDGGVRVDAVLVIEVDVVGSEPLERAFDSRLDIAGAAVDDSGAAAGVRDQTELRRDDDIIAPPLTALPTISSLWKGP